MIKWEEIERSIEVKLVAPFDLINEVRDWKRDAQRRATEALIDGLGDEGKYKYLNDVQFHHTINLFIQVTVAAVFDEIPLSEKEKADRYRQITGLMRNL